MDMECCKKTLKTLKKESFENKNRPQNKIDQLLNEIIKTVANKYQIRPSQVIISLGYSDDDCKVFGYPIGEMVVFENSLYRSK